MNIRRWVAVAMLAVFAAAAAFAAPATLAYISARSNTLHNQFTRVDFPPIGTSVQVNVHKTVLSDGSAPVSPEGFRFSLAKAGGETVILTSDKDGRAALTLNFAQQDLGREHVYTLAEMNDKQPCITYSDAVYEIRITLTLDEENRIVAAVEVNGRAADAIHAEFTNLYHAPVTPPLTGDPAQPVLWCLLAVLSGCAAVLLYRRGTMAHRRIL